MELDISVFDGLIAVIVPALVRLTIKALNGVPKWIVPTILVPLFGAFATIAANALDLSSLSPWLGVIVGGVGLYFRELIDQVRRAIRTVGTFDPIPHTNDPKG